MIDFNSKIWLWSLVLFLLLGFYPGYGQEPTAKELSRKQAREAIKNLKESVLVVRLTSKNNKIEELNKLLSSTPLSTKDRSRLEKQLKDTKKDNDQFNRLLVAALNEEYKFSKFLIMYDTASTSLKKGVRSGYFLDDQLNISKETKLGADGFFVLRIGTTDIATTSGIHALIIMDEQFNDLQPPFPYYSEIKNLGLAFMSLFFPKKAVHRGIKESVVRLNRRLSSYYNRTIN